MRRLLYLGYWRDDGSFPLTWYHTCYDQLVEKLCDRCHKNRGSQSQEPGWYSIQTCSCSFKRSNIWKTSISDIQSVSSAVVDFRNIIHQKHYPLFHWGSALDQKAAVWPQHRCARNKATIPKNGMLLPYLVTVL